MISQVTGEVAAIGATWVVIDVNGMGLQISTTPTTTASLHLGHRATLYTYLIVREDALSLYGFADRTLRDCFVMCLGASGVGPKLALAICSVMTPEQFTAAVHTEDYRALCQVPGIGKKGAQKIVLELKDKVDALGASHEPLETPLVSVELWREQVAQGLESLGWSSKDAEAACTGIEELAAQEPQPSVAELMKAALASLARA